MLRFLCLLCLLLVALPLHAQAIHRCLGGDGTPVFTDQPCAALNASAAAHSSAPSQTTPGSAMATQPPAITCAATPEILRQGVVDAFATRDPNRLASLMLWGGYGRQGAVTQIRDLGELMKRPLIGIDMGDKDDADGNAGDEDGTPSMQAHGLIVRTASDDGSGTARETRFALERRSGCFWLRP